MIGSFIILFTTAILGLIIVKLNIHNPNFIYEKEINQRDNN